MEIVEPPAQAPAAAAGAGTSQAGPSEAGPSHAAVAQEDSDDEVECTGHNGDIALEDFPHARHTCLAQRVTSKSSLEAWKQHCPNCYCYVCDDMASRCEKWNEHCVARPGSPWDALRIKYRQEKTLSHLGPNLFDEPLTAYRRIHVDEHRHSVTLKTHDGTEKVYSLHPVQRQSLAWMLATERDGFSFKDVSSMFTCSRDGPDLIRGGFLSDEVGMGKTLTCLALIDASPMTGITLVVVPTNLIAQWTNYLEQFERAHGIAYDVLYNRSVTSALRKFHAAPDAKRILLACMSSRLPDEMHSKINRVIVDESHKICTKIQSGPGTCGHHLFKTESLISSTRWCVTGTPFEKIHDSNFSKQLAVVFPYHGRGGRMFVESARRELAFKFIMRHEIDMKLATGETALIIPKVVNSSMNLRLSEGHRRLYDMCQHIDFWGEPLKNHENIDKHIMCRRACLYDVPGLHNRFYRFALETYFAWDETHHACAHQMYLRACFLLQHTPIDLSTEQVSRILQRLQEGMRDDPLRRYCIVSQNQKFIDALVLKLSEHGIQYVVAVKKSHWNRECSWISRSDISVNRALERFKTTTAPVLITTRDVMQVGQDLKCAQEIISADITGGAADNEQQKARIRRCGVAASTALACKHFIHENTIDEINEAYQAQEDRTDVDVFHGVNPHTFGTFETICMEIKSEYVQSAIAMHNVVRTWSRRRNEEVVASAIVPSLLVRDKSIVLRFNFHRSPAPMHVHRDYDVVPMDTWSKWEKTRHLLDIFRAILPGSVSSLEQRIRASHPEDTTRLCRRMWEATIQEYPSFPQMYTMLIIKDQDAKSRSEALGNDADHLTSPNHEVHKKLSLLSLTTPQTTKTLPVMARAFLKMERSFCACCGAWKVRDARCFFDGELLLPHEQIGRLIRGSNLSLSLNKQGCDGAFPFTSTPSLGVPIEYAPPPPLKKMECFKMVPANSYLLKEGDRSATRYVPCRYVSKDVPVLRVRCRFHAPMAYGTRFVFSYDGTTYHSVVFEEAGGPHRELIRYVQLDKLAEQEVAPEDECVACEVDADDMPEVDVKAKACKRARTDDEDEMTSWKRPCKAMVA